MPSTLSTRAVASRPKGLLLSLISALVFTAMGSVELFIPSLSPRAGDPAPLTLRIPYGPRLMSRDEQGGPHNFFEHRRIVVPRGETIALENEDHRAAMAFEQQKRPQRFIRFASQFVIHFLLDHRICTKVWCFGFFHFRCADNLGNASLERKVF